MRYRSRIRRRIGIPARSTLEEYMVFYRQARWPHWAPMNGTGMRSPSAAGWLRWLLMVKRSSIIRKSRVLRVARLIAAKVSQALYTYRVIILAWNSGRLPSFLRSSLPVPAQGAGIVQTFSDCFCLILQKQLLWQRQSDLF